VGGGGEKHRLSANIYELFAGTNSGRRTYPGNAYISWGIVRTNNNDPGRTRSWRAFWSARSRVIIIIPRGTAILRPATALGKTTVRLRGANRHPDRWEGGVCVGVIGGTGRMYTHTHTPYNFPLLRPANRNG